MQRASKVPVIGVAGWKNSGKTTLVVRLIEEFARRGLKVATVKHSHHAIAYESDDTDSARHRKAGAGQTALVSSERWGLITELGGAPEPALEKVIEIFDRCDLIIVEGFKSAAIPKIEVRRQASQTRDPLADNDPLVVAIAADHPVSDAKVPVYRLDDIAGIADCIGHVAGCLNSKAEPER